MAANQEFEGFPASGLQFFADLKENNNREWFSDHKSVFDDDVVEPAQAFIVSLGSMLKGLHPGVNFDTRANGAGSMFRIYRDVRFSKDKSPYKTHLGMVFWLGRGKKTESPGFYVGLGSSGASVYGGMWHLPKDRLGAFRKSVDDPAKGDQLAEILNNLREAGYEVGDQSYKRVPSGFNPDHPHADLLRYSSVHAARPSIAASVVTSPGFVPEAFEHCANYLPMVEWLEKNT